MYTPNSTEEKILHNLTAIMLGVDGIKAAYERAPLSLPEDKLPCNVNIMGAVDDITGGGPGIDIITRTIYVRIYAAHAEQGVSGDAETIVIPFLSSVPPVLRANTTLNSVPYVTESAYQGIRDGGVAVLPSYSGDSYLGVEFRLRVKYIERYSYQPLQ
jgi:hypothetical protein